MGKKQSRVDVQTLQGLSKPMTMPEGYYSGDKPNPNLRRFIEEHARPYNLEEDDYAVSDFTRPIETKRSTAIYNMHTYWSKKPHDAIRQYIRHYTRPGDIVLDPLCGSGSTILAALLEGRKGIAIDRSPAATFITKGYCTPIEPATLEAASASLYRRVSSEMTWLYATRCDRCDGEAATHFTVYSQVFQCPRCLTKIPLFDCPQINVRTENGKSRSLPVCPVCYNKGHSEAIRSQSEKFGFRPVLVSYHCHSGCRPLRGERLYNDPIPKKRQFFERFDLAKLQEIDRRSIPYWYPKGYSMKGFSRYQRDALYYYGVSEVMDLFTKRNLWGLAAIMHAINQDTTGLADTLKFCFTSIALKASRMMAHNNDGIGRIQKGTYYIPQIEHDINVLQFFEEAVRDMAAGYEEMGLIHPDCLISTENSCHLDLPPNSIDYIFTDPAYAGTVQYGELNFVWEAWLGAKAQWHDEEIVVNNVRGKSEADWAAMMRHLMERCFHALKPGCCISVCYHDTSEGTWALLQDIMSEAGFIAEGVETALYIESKTKTVNQYFADKVTKRDLVLNFRKPKRSDWIVSRIYIPADADIPTFSDLAQQVIRDFLTSHPGATKDRIYDELVSHMVRKGQMEPHDFDRLLGSVAEEVRHPVKINLFDNKEPDLFGSHVESRWYLRETADEIDKAEQEKEDAAAARLEEYMSTYVENHPEDGGVHYSDLFEQYLPVADKPRRLLADWLPEYFFKTTFGTWLPPYDEKERQQKAALREAGTLRHIKRFANALIDGVPVREQDRPSNDRTLAEWMRQCRRAGLYEQGRVLYEKGGLDLTHLSEEEQIAVEDDYRICVRRGSPQDEKPKRRRRKEDDDV